MHIKIGDQASLTKSFSIAEVATFAQLSLDSNPLHANTEMARQSMFGQPVVHGSLVAGLISAVLGAQLPGPGTIYLSQSLNFKAPVFIGDEVIARVVVTKMRPEKGILTLATTCIRQDGTLVIEGQAVVMHPDLKEAAH